MARQHQDRGRAGASAGGRPGPGSGRRGGWRAVPAGSEVPGPATSGGRSRRPARRTHMKSFLHLESAPSSPASSLASLTADDWVCVGENDASFLLSSPTSSTSATDNTIMNARTTAAGAPAASGATTNTLATADLGARQIASSSTSVTDMTDIEPSVVCSPATSTASSGASKPQVLRHRHSMHPTLRQLRFHETASRDNGDALGGKHMESLGAWDWDNNNDTTQHIASRSPNVRHRYQHSVRRGDHDTRPDRCPSSPPGEQQSLQTWNRSKKGQSVSNITHTSSEESSYIGTDYAAPSTAMTREQFEALPATVQRKVSSAVDFRRLYILPRAARWTRTIRQRMKRREPKAKDTELYLTWHDKVSAWLGRQWRHKPRHRYRRQDTQTHTCNHASDGVSVGSVSVDGGWLHGRGKKQARHAHTQVQKECMWSASACMPCDAMPAAAARFSFLLLVARGRLCSACLHFVFSSPAGV